MVTLPIRYDHDSGDAGFYIYLDTSTGSSGDYAQLLSGTITPSSDGVCLLWWYNMNGPDINRLEVWKYGSIKEWVRAGHQGPDWKQGQLFLTGSFRADFQGYRSSGDRGEIAIDDISFSSGNCPPQRYCDFEHGDWCGFDQDYNDQGDWNVEPNDFSSLALTYGPDTDHTYGTSLGHFIYVDSVVNNVQAKVRLISPVYPSTFQRCLRLWAFRSGNSPPQLTATVTIGDTPLTQILSIDEGAGADVWLVYEASLSSSLSYTIVFEATVGSDGVLALDDIDLNKDYCSPVGSCDFEYDTCTYWNEPSNDDFDWIRWSGQTPSLNSGPDTDHSTGTPAGVYMYIDSAAPRQNGDNAILISPSVEGTKCLSIWYYIDGALGALLEVITDDNVIWNQPGSSTGAYWLHATVSTSSASPTYMVRVKGSVGTPSQSDIAIDDISIFDGPCAGATNPPPCQFYCDNDVCLKDATLVCNFKDDCGDSSDEFNCGTCDFESDWCNYTDTSIGSMVWQRGKGSTSTAGTGPSTDHTTDSSEGYYLYIDASQGSSYSEASLMSPEMNEASPTCILEIWIHMYGKDIGSLGTYIVSGLERALLFWDERTNRDEWFRSSVGVGRIRGTFQIQILAQRSFDVIGDIAIDDITFRDCGFPDPPPEGCTSDEFTCANLRCIVRDRLCDLTDDCGDMSDEINCETYERCSFENGICSWTQLTTDEYDWRYYSGITRTPWTGPARDHTTGLPAGYYIYLEASDAQPGDRARLASRTLTSVTSSGCFLRFYYHMFGDDIDQLNVYTRQAINGPLTRIWNREGDIGDYYLRADIEIDSPQYPVQVIIEATRGAGIYGDIAIDDTSFTPGCVFSDTPLATVSTVAPTQPPTLPYCPPDTFQCNNGTCLDVQQRCNLENDCLEGEDEINCGDCDFELDTCGYTSIPNGEYLWTRIQASDAISGRGPSVDHTKDSGDGYYMFVDSTYGLFGMTALLISPVVLGEAGSRCELEFYYHMLGGQVGSLSVIIYENGYPDASWVMAGDQGSSWNRGSLMVGPHDAGQYYARFEASPGVGFDETTEPTDIALDDIRFINCGKSADLDCNFGEAAGTLCGWSQNVDTDTVDWTLFKGRTPTGYTGPQFDHTDGLGYYVYLETSYLVNGDFARLESGILRSTDDQPYCLSFWYLMYGSTVGTFKVFKRDTDTEDEVLVSINPDEYNTVVQ
ncbi:MAM and LDL-receptor class A domain-containing protein 1-like [Lytechinus variegatus]|uniref:MAM and LDL-receptor class A domain-containing protein 1-like n=1 Tax=Lytechinus variegatus TaxID=7654 RepID=UPI001BB1098B|nr:MAM and LDL-receptor class A domain-containing protein 1-like [Lytechinus variegatus]